ncbi:hypothetical protein COR50_05630 [Chitinophaga caeni]|uniref:6-bladed beta-propeller n=1 Tax=Chitinophaga caeni TaxID=2029983 RepID=A0A291QS14_9BACT|nr:6-bladed beta-propeller [Chitinophaga caeni]ATL46701.1 hypothetical protein COR50_05630 [Chitinophaga caeni]
MKCIKYIVLLITYGTSFLHRLKSWNFFVISICFLFYSSCNIHTEQLNTEGFSDSLTVSINLKDTSINTTGELFDSIEYIFLESSTEESIFSNIDKIEITDNYYIILDTRTNKLLFFNKDGRFSHSLPQVLANGDSIFTTLSDFTVNENKEEILIYDSGIAFDGVIKTDFHGTYKLASRTPMSFNEFALGEGGMFYYKRYSSKYYKSVESNNENHLLYYVSDSSSIKYLYFSYDSKIINGRDMYDLDHMFTRSGNKVYFQRPFDYSVYEFNMNGTKSLRIDFLFPNYSKFPEDFLRNNKYLGNRISEFKAPSNKLKIWTISSYHRVLNSIIFNINIVGSKDFSFLYNLKNKKYYNIENIYSSSISNWMPFFEDRIIAADNKSYYSYITPKLMLQAYRTLGDRHLKNSPFILKKIKELTIFSNPILVRLEPRSN